MISIQNSTSVAARSGNGNVSIYAKKNLSSRPIIQDILVSGSLKENGEFAITLNNQKFSFESSAARQGLRCGYGIGFSAFTNSDFFEGSFMDDINFETLNENISTDIVGGNLIALNRAKKVSFIGELKKIDDIIYLNSSFILAKNGLPNHRGALVQFDCIEFEIELKLE